MEVNEANLSSLIGYLQNTLNPDPAIRRSAESFLQSIEANEGYVRLLMALLDRSDVASEIRVVCGVTLKNFVKRNWPSIEGEKPRISESDREFVKSNVISLMLSSHDSVRRQLAEAISLIGLQDFPEKWPKLIFDFTEKFSSGDFRVINCILFTADTLFKRYCHEMKSDQLWTEIKYVLTYFAQPLTDLFSHVYLLALQQLPQDGSAAPNDANAALVLKPIYECLTLISSIFYSLNAQDLPEFFEDHMQEWMDGFLKLLGTDVPSLRGDQEEETGIVEQLWTQICDNITLYAQKYDEEFDQYLQRFVSVVWHLLLTTGQQTKYDSLVSNAMQFLASVCERDQYKSLFSYGDTLAQICEKVIVPNIELRESDVELFEDNAEEFIRRDIEGSDVDTRRRAAADLVKALCRNFEADVVRIFAAYINQLFLQYSTNQEKFWPKKDAAVYLVVSLTSKGQTARLGATKTSELVNLVDFYNAQIVADLSDPQVNRLPVLKADALKYLVTFRAHLPKEILLTSALPNCIRLLTADSVVVHSYAAHALERILISRKAEKPREFLLTADELKPYGTNMLQNLFAVLEKDGSTENEYAIKCVMRTCLILSDSILPYSTLLIKQIARKICIVAKNPSRPFFNHYLFESLCILIKAVCKANQETGAKIFEDALFPPFQEILQQDVLEFMPYVFQVLSLILDTRPPNSGIPPTYETLFPFLLVPTLWERQGNVPALVKLLQAYIRVGAEQVIANHLNPVLGVFQKLLASRANDNDSFHILNALVEYGKWESLSPVMKRVFFLIFTRLSNNKTAKLVKNLIYFTSLFIIRYQSKTLIELIDSIQPNMFGMYLEKIMIPDLQKISGKLEKKVCSVAIVRLLSESPDIMLNETYGQIWPTLLQALVALFELPEEASGEEDLADVEEAQGYTAAYSQLAYAARPETDPTGLQPQQDPKMLLAKSLEKLRSTRGPLVDSMLGRLDEQPRNYVKQYFTNAGLIVT